MNGNSGVVLALLAWLVLQAPLAAQRREPFSGVVRDPAGKPVAGAQVVCEWRPDGVVLGMPDRREAKTDADGRFTLDLWIGRAYCVFAIGPADGERRRLVAPPCFDAVGGRQLDLVTRRLMPPVRLQVAGTTPWTNDGPLSLRVFVATGAALPDITIPGDGALTLPPLPTTLLTVCLLDGKQQTLDAVSIDVDAEATCNFAATTDADFVVEDLAGAPVAGARILTRHGFQHGLTPRLGAWGSYTVTQRVVAVTDAEGKARGRIRDDRSESRFTPPEGPTTTTMFTAFTDTGSSQVAGYVGKRRIEGGKAGAAGDGEPFRCQLQPHAMRTVQLVGAGDELVMHGELRGSQFWRAFNAGGLVDWRAPLNLAGEAWTGNVPNQPPNQAYAWFVGDGKDSRPLRVVVGTAGDRAHLAELRALAVRVVDADGKPAAFAAVGVSHGLQGFPVHWTTHLVTDAQGRADLRMRTEPCELYATTATAHGYAQVPDRTTTEANIRLQPLATARFRVVDAAGKPVAGAHLRGEPRTIPNDGVGRIVACGLGDLLAGVESDADGLAVVRIPREAEGSHEVTANWRGKSSPRASVQCDRAEPIELRLPH